MKKPLKVIGLDFDGTLVESNRIKDQAFDTIFSAWPEHRESMLAWHRARNAVARHEKFRYFVEDVLEELGNTKKIDLLTSRFSSLTREAIINCPWVAGAIEFLENYINYLPLYLISATPQKELEEITSQRGISKFFKSIYGAPLDKNLILQKILDTEEISAKEMLYIGDSPEDQIAAKNLGIDFIGVDSKQGLIQQESLISSEFISILKFVSKNYKVG